MTHGLPSILVIATVVALALVPHLEAAAPATGRVSGSVRQAGTEASVRFAQVRIEGAALTGRENNQIIQKIGADGRYRLDVPPGTYELWAAAPDHEEVLKRVELSAGAALQVDLNPSNSAAHRAHKLGGLLVRDVGAHVEGDQLRRLPCERRNDRFNVAAPRCDDPIDRVERHDLPGLHRHATNNGVSHRLNDAEGSCGSPSRLHAWNKLLKRERRVPREERGDPFGGIAGRNDHDVRR